LNIPIPRVRRQPRGRHLTLIEASANNLKDITVRIPLGLFTCITGVSGSGKVPNPGYALPALAKKIYHSKV
jgi:excinuclease ABC subunit A